MANPIVGTLSSPHSIYDTSLEHAHTLGSRGALPDGRVFYYTQAPAAGMDVGKVHVVRERVPEHQDAAVGAATAGVAGSYVVDLITIAAVAMTENQYRDGYLAVTDGAGEGRLYRIRNHEAFLASATTVRVTLYDPIKVSLASTSTVSFIYNLYSQPKIADVDQLDVLAGIPTATFAASEYGWLQTWGPCPVWFTEAITAVGEAVVIGTDAGTPGAAEEDDTATTVSQEQIIGYNLTPGVDTEYQVVDLRIRP